MQWVIPGREIRQGARQTVGESRQCGEIERHPMCLLDDGTTSRADPEGVGKGGGDSIHGAAFLV